MVREKRMAEHEGTETVDAQPDALFDYLSDVSHLPAYFSRMTEASAGEGEEVHTAARMPNGEEVRGDAWFHVDDSARCIEWGSEGPNDYHGWLQVAEAPGGSAVEVHISTERVANGEVDRGIAETLANIKRIVEGS